MIIILLGLVLFAFCSAILYAFYILLASVVFFVSVSPWYFHKVGGTDLKNHGHFLLVSLGHDALFAFLVVGIPWIFVKLMFW